MECELNDNNHIHWLILKLSNGLDKWYLRNCYTSNENRYTLTVTDIVT